MTATLLDIAKDVAKDVGLAQPTAVVSATDDTDRGMVEMLQNLNFVGEELSRRVDWSALRNETTLTGTGAAVAHALPAGYMRMLSGNAVKRSTTLVPIRGGMSAEEFKSLTAVEGAPRYYFVGGVDGARTIELWPYLANGVTATALWQSKNWSPTSIKYVSDTDVCLVPDQLMIKGGIARWRRQKGMDYPDYVAEYEAALANFATFDDNARSP